MFVVTQGFPRNVNLILQGFGSFVPTLSPDPFRCQTTSTGPDPVRSQGTQTGPDPIRSQGVLL